MKLIHALKIHTRFSDLLPGDLFVFESGGSEGSIKMRLDGADDYVHLTRADNIYRAPGSRRTITGSSDKVRRVDASLTLHSIAPN